MTEKINNVLNLITGVKIGTWVRLAMLIISFVNLGLAYFGKGPIEVQNENLYTIFSLVFAAAVGILNYWKNNSFTKAAQKADEYLHSQGMAQEESLL